MIFNQRLPQIILLITVLFLFPAIINASDSYIAAIVDLGMEGGFGGGAWYTDYYWGKEYYLRPDVLMFLQAFSGITVVQSLKRL